MANSNVVSFADRKRDLEAKSSFLDMLDSDIQNVPAGAVPIPRSLFDGIARIKAKAEENKRRELLEG
jgi:hypothetical protein